MKVLDNVKNVAADVVLTGEKQGSLFVMSTGEAYVKKTSQIDSAAIWHACLGHLGYQMLQQLSSKRLEDGMPTLKNVHEDVICQGCQFGKSHRLPFSSHQIVDLPCLSWFIQICWDQRRHQVTVVNTISWC